MPPTHTHAYPGREIHALSSENSGRCAERFPRPRSAQASRRVSLTRGKHRLMLHRAREDSRARPGAWHSRKPQPRGRHPATRGRQEGVSGGRRAFSSEPGGQVWTVAIPSPGRHAGFTPAARSPAALLPAGCTAGSDGPGTAARPAPSPALFSRG